MVFMPGPCVQSAIMEFVRDKTIFAEENALRDSYQPDDLVEREEELAAYQDALQPVINGARPKNIFLYGQTGVGKTIATDLIMESLLESQEQYPDLDLEVVKLVCKSLSSSYQVTAHLVNEFRPPEEQIKPTGYPTGMINGMLWDHLNELDATHCLIILDEIDAIGNDDDILYELPRCNDNDNVTETQVGVIGISNDFTFRDNLSARVKDSLCDEEIHFPPYDANELRTILQDRAETAFIDTRRSADRIESTTLSGGVIQLAAARAAQDSGSARQALKLLYKAGDLARSAGEDEVREEHIREADSIIEKNKVRDELERLPTQSKLTLYALLQLDYEGATPAKRNAIYERYTIAAERIESDVKSDRTVHDRLSQLTLKGFLDVKEENLGPKGGSYYEYSFSVRPDLVREVLEEDSRTTDLFA